MAYDIVGVFEDIELSLIRSMRANMKRHIDEEYQEGINWTQWQAEMLAGLSQYRAENKDVLKGYMNRINAELDLAIKEAYASGESEQEIELLEAIKRGYEAPEDNVTELQGRFFRSNQRKLNALIEATTKDMKKAESALLRMNDDVARQTIFKAQMFYNTGAGSMWKCVDMATKDFLSAGFNCVQYKNGVRVNIASYAEMALRTANKRANLMGQANFREKHAIHTVKVNARGTACPRCMEFLGKVFIDDVYGAGTAKESKASGYPLLSSAVAQGLYHPNCKDACSTFYEGINRPSKPLTKAEREEAQRRYDLEQKQRYYERNYRKYTRLAEGSLDPDNVKEYKRKANACMTNLKQLVADNEDVLRLDRERLKLRGILQVTPQGSIKVPKTNKNANMRQIQSDNDTFKKLKSLNITHNAVEKLPTKENFNELVKNLGGGDLTKGSCASVALAYVGRNQGYNVLDFRDGASREFFSGKLNKVKMWESLGIEPIKEDSFKSSLANGKKVLKSMVKGKEYYLSVGGHAAITRLNEDGVMQYLELQTNNFNGWVDFGDVGNTLRYRFGCSSSSRYIGTAYMTDLSLVKNNKDFIDILGFINTAETEQKKGASGYAR